MEHRTLLLLSAMFAVTALACLFLPALMELGDGPGPAAAPGQAAITITALASHDRSPVPGTLELWRIGWPEDEAWTAGDEYAGRQRTDAAGRVQFTGLDPGEYRVRVFSRRRGTSDPAAFRVHGTDDHITLRVKRPRETRLSVTVYGEDGAILRDAHIARLKEVILASWPRRLPAWARPRRQRYWFPIPLRGPPTPATAHPDGPRPAAEPVAVTATRDGFALPGRLEPEEYARRATTYEITWSDRSSVLVEADRRVARGPRRFVAASIPLARLHEAVRLPDGRRAVDAGATFSAQDRARLVGLDGQAPSWERLSVEVRVTLEGYRAIKRKIRLGEPLPTWTLRRSP